MKKILGFFLTFLYVLCFFILYSENIQADEKTPELYAKSAVLMDGESGRILFDKNGNSPLPMASTTKIMTCILALENGDPKMICTATENAAAQPKVHLGMIVGEKFYLSDLLYSLMLESHNDSAMCIAESLAGNKEQFAAWMNKKAEEIGCTDTYFITPNGLDAENETGIHHTTAADLARIMRYCLRDSTKREEFRMISSAQDHTFTDLKGNRQYSCRNHNALLQMMKGAVSGKTGFTAKAGYCYIGAIEQDGKTMIVSLLACGWPSNRGYKWVDTRKLVTFGKENFSMCPLQNPEYDQGNIEVQNGIKDKVSLAAVHKNNKNRIKTVLKRKDEKIRWELKITPKIEAPISKGTVVGKICCFLEKTEIDEWEVVTSEQIDKRDYGFYLLILLNKLLI